MTDNSARRRDPWRLAAQKAGYRSRAAFKLEQLQRRYRILRPGSCVLDLGAAPGGWSQVAARELAGKGRILAVDRQSMQPVDGVEFLKLDLEDEADLQTLLKQLPRLDLVLSDMAPSLTGVAPTDQSTAAELVRVALSIAQSSLKKRGCFVCKLLQGEGFAELHRELKQSFDTIRFHSPEASRSGSKEIFCVARFPKGP